MRWIWLVALAGCAHPTGPFAKMAREMRDVHAPVGNVIVQATPSDAEVFVDGVEQGLASDFDGVHGALQLSSGPHTLVVRQDGYQSFTITIFANDDGRQSVQVRLDKSR